MITCFPIHGIEAKSEAASTCWPRCAAWAVEGDLHQRAERRDVLTLSHRTGSGRARQTQGDSAENERESQEGDKLEHGFRLTGFFLDREVFAPRGLTLPETRRAYVEAVARVTRSGTPAASPSA